MNRKPWVAKRRRAIGGRALQERNGRIKLRDCFHCCECSRICLPHQLEVDHVVALANGGTDDDANLQSLCIECHTAKTARDVGRTYKPETGADGWPTARG